MKSGRLMVAMAVGLAAGVSGAALGQVRDSDVVPSSKQQMMRRSPVRPSAERLVAASRQPAQASREAQTTGPAGSGRAATGRLLASAVPGETVGLENDQVSLSDVDGGYSSLSSSSGSYGWGWYGGGWSRWPYTNTNFHGRYWFWDRWTRDPIDGPVGFSLETTAGPEPEPVVVLTVVQQADAALAERNAEAAIELYEEHLAADPDDAVAMRSMGIALAAAGRLEDGFALVRLAYFRDPGLAKVAVDPGLLGSTPAGLRRLLVRCVQRAHRENTSSAWLMVAVLMQGEGRAEPGLRMLERADELGLEIEIVRALRAELSL